MNDAVTNAVKIYHLDLNHLIIDATRIKIWKDKELMIKITSFDVKESIPTDS
ncbi:hypothetical protein ig2599ANME_0294 [groundwater metagenome]